MLDSSSVAENDAEPALVLKQTISPWCNCRSKRVFDIAIAGALLIASSPVLLASTLLIRLTSRGPILFCHKRLGKDGNQISVLKFRTMVHQKDIQGPEVTRSGDCRVTPVGRCLRKWKIDELPQLLNVLRGDMSTVGPRPDSAKYLEHLSPQYRGVLSVRPGVTSPATIAFRNEEQLLSAIPEQELEEVYCSKVLPLKIQLELDYLKGASFVSDIKVLLRTAVCVFFGARW
jgi:lipopolysaccharide/colanic/teichoic acid biosynthesis glycosyltransferase